MASAEIRATRLGGAVIGLSVAAWVVVAVVSSRIPSPAHEARFVDPTGRTVTGRTYCHGMVAVDGDVVWSVCQRDAPRPSSHLARFATSTGAWTLLGAIADDVTSLGGATAGPAGTRVFLVGNRLYETRDDSVREVARTSLPLGLARVEDRVECVERFGTADVTVRRLDDGRALERREMRLGVDASDGRTREPVSAFFDEGRWHVLVQEHSGVHTPLPLDVTVYDHVEGQRARLVDHLRLGESVVQADATGTVAYVPSWLIAGAVASRSPVVHEVYVYGGNHLQRVGFEGAPFVDVVATVVGDGPHALPMVADLSERHVQVGGSGPRFERVRVRDRFDALRVDRRTGPPVVASFWIDGGFRVVPMRDGGYVLLGALGGSYLRLGQDLRRLDGLSIPQRFARLFVEDRAKRNSDFFHGGGALRATTVPWMLVGVLVGFAVVALRRRPALASRIGWTWLLVALSGAWHFAYVLRYYW